MTEKIEVIADYRTPIRVPARPGVLSFGALASSTPLISAVSVWF